MTSSSVPSGPILGIASNGPCDARMVTVAGGSTAKAYGVWPEECRHKCDNKACFRLDHLEDGTHADNMRDASERGQMVSGLRNHQSKLNPEAVRAIRWLAANGRTGYAIAKAYRLSLATIYDVINGRSWKEVA